MTVSDWNSKASKLLGTCESEIDNRNGSSKMNTSEAKKLNQLQHDIGSHHGIHEVTYKEGKSTLEQMMGWVAQGLKTPPLTAG